MNARTLAEITGKHKERVDNLECLGCRIANQIEPDVQVVYENEYICCVLDIAPFNEGHVLILPKAHYRDLEEIDEITLKAR